MNIRFEHKLRTFARKYLPGFIRRFFGYSAGVIKGIFIYPALGFIFDICGGIYKVNGCSFRIPKNLTSMQFRASFFLKDYEKEEIYFVQKYVKNSDSVLELGACLGILSCLTNIRLDDNEKHVVVEANPYLINTINENKIKNKCGYNILNLAVSNLPSVEFFINKTHVTGSSLLSSQAMKVKVPGISLSELVAKYGPFNVLIIDIEGSEVDILRERLPCEEISTIIIEIHDSIIGPKGVSLCHQSLIKSGFQLVEKIYLTEVWQKINK